MADKCEPQTPTPLSPYHTAASASPRDAPVLPPALSGALSEDWEFPFMATNGLTGALRAVGLDAQGRRSLVAEAGVAALALHQRQEEMEAAAALAAEKPQPKRSQAAASPAPASPTPVVQAAATTPSSAAPPARATTNTSFRLGFSELISRIGTSSSASDKEALKTASSGNEANTSFGTEGAAGGVAPPPEPHRARVHIVGDPGSGKTTLKACIIQPGISGVIKSLPEVPVSLSSGHSVYFFSSRRHGKLDITLVDGGPLENSHAGVPLFAYHSQNCFIITVNLSSVKQHHRRGGNSSPAPSQQQVHIHPRDVAGLRRHLEAIAVAAPSSAIVLVGTHKDMLSRQDAPDVRAVLHSYSAAAFEEIRRINEALTPSDEQPQHRNDASSAAAAAAARPRSRPRRNAMALTLLATFAVSCTGRSCVSENADGPGDISQMWDLVCEMVFKRTLSHQCYSRVAQLRQQPSFLALSVLIERARAELGFVLIDTAQLWQAAYASGVVSADSRRAIVTELCNAGDVLMIRQQSLLGAGGRHDVALLHPHLLNRAAAVVVLFAQTWSYPATMRSKMVPGLDHAACDSADPARWLAKGILGGRLLSNLARTLATQRRSVDDRAQLFVSLLLLSDFVFPLPDQRLDVGSAGGGLPPALTAAASATSGAAPGTGFTAGTSASFASGAGVGASLVPSSQASDHDGVDTPISSQCSTVADDEAPFGLASTTSSAPHFGCHSSSHLMNEFALQQQQLQLPPQFYGHASPQAPQQQRPQHLASALRAAAVYAVPSMMLRRFPTVDAMPVIAEAASRALLSVGRRLVTPLSLPGFFHALQCRLGFMALGRHAVFANALWCRPPRARGVRVLLLHRQIDETEAGDALLSPAAATPASSCMVVDILVMASSGQLAVAQTVVATVVDTVTALAKARFVGSPAVFVPLSLATATVPVRNLSWSVERQKSESASACDWCNVTQPSCAQPTALPNRRDDSEGPSASAVCLRLLDGLFQDIPW